MAQSLSDAFTIGGLDRGRMDGTILVAMRGTIHQIDDGLECAFNVDQDGATTTVSGSTDPVLDLQFGAGRIELLDINIAGTGGVVEGSAVSLAVTFGESVDEQAGSSLSTGGIEIIGVIANAGWSGGDVGGQIQRIYTHGIAPPDNTIPAPVGIKKLRGNTVDLNIGVPYENEGGTQLELSSLEMLNFDIIAIAKGRMVGV